MSWVAFLVKEINFDVYLVLDFQRHIHPHTHLRQLARNTSMDMEVMMIIDGEHYGEDRGGDDDDKK